ncbi:TetR/AcrR family transcriptional regulator [Cohnella yongneupensis]|uniref:TetR/AcrR family transcriptional regulator n=1 Tax=Cohnella yongneupensis TaxID=425006 RepID=A0ABW0QXE7_9BACL
MEGKKESASERILRVADDLFYREGIRAVGIDRIIAESGVAKASFYRNFATKDDLIVAYLEHRLGRIVNFFARARSEPFDSEPERLRSLMDKLAENMKQYGYRGCPFMNTAVEFPDIEHPGHAKALECRSALWEELEQVVQQAGIAESHQLVEQIRMLWSGAVMVAYINKAEFRPELFSSAAKTLIDSQLAANET